MYNPCFECVNKRGWQYTSKCDDICDYAQMVKKSKGILLKIASAISDSDCNCPCSEGCRVITDEDCIERIENWLIKVSGIGD